MEVENSIESEPFTIDNNTRWQVIGYYECCLNQQQTADNFGIHQSSDSRILSKFQVSGSVSNYQKSGRNQILGSNEECQIEEIVKKNRYSTAQEIADNFNVSKNTVFAEREFKSKTRRKSTGEWYLLQDNAPSHRREQHCYSTTTSQQSGSKIELVWSILKRLVEKSQPKNEESLSSCIVSCWDSIPQSQIQSFIEHFQRRVDQVFSLNGSFY